MHPLLHHIKCCPCTGFCKEAKATNHCKFCKCRACPFCAAQKSTASKPELPTAGAGDADSGRRRRGGAVLKKAKGKGKGKRKAEAAMGSDVESKEMKKMKKKKKKLAAAE